MFFRMFRQFQRYQTLYICFYRKPIFNIAYCLSPRGKTAGQIYNVSGIGEKKKEQFFAKFLNVMKILFFILTRQFQRYQTLYMCFYKKNPIFNICILMLTACRLAWIPQAKFTMYRWKKEHFFGKVSQCYEYIFIYIDERIRAIPNTIYLFLKKKKNKTKTKTTQTHTHNKISRFSTFVFF
jgi:hypothetical protein